MELPLLPLAACFDGDITGKAFPEKFSGCGKRGALLNLLSNHDQVTPRFITLADVANILNVAPAQVYALVRSGDLPAIKIGVRGQWRVEAAELEKFISSQYQRTAEFVKSHPR